MANTQKVVYIAGGTEQAHMLKSVLLQQGIVAYVTNEALQFGVGDLPPGLPTAPRVVVHEYDAEEARQIALDFDEALREGAFAAHEEDELEADREEATLWPACPHCNRPRHTNCPVCETAGTDFPSAFMPDNEPASGIAAVCDREKLLIVCPICDEVFEPQFPARCEWCGHRFPDGRELPPPKPLGDSLEINNRVWVLFIGLVVLIGGAVALFVHIASKR